MLDKRLHMPYCGNATITAASNGVRHVEHLVHKVCGVNAPPGWLGTAKLAAKGQSKTALASL